MRIVIDPFKKESIDAAIKQLEQYERDFKAKEVEFIRRLKELGVSVATTGFAMAEYDGTNDVLIAETQSGTRAAVIAYGETVAFIEFGTGIKFPEWSGSGKTGYTPPSRGTYGEGRGKQPHGWWYNPDDVPPAVHTRGNPPAEAMLAARDKMIEQITTIAREVWK